MPRNMSCMLTIDQVKAEIKDVTRRDGWWFLKPGEIVNLVEKCQGLKKGEKVVHLKQVRIVSTRPELLLKVTKQECIREGFPELTPVEFVRMFLSHNKKLIPTSVINRIEFEYVKVMT